MPPEDLHPADFEDTRTQLLVADARTGSAQALTELYARVAPMVHAWVRLRLGAGLQGRLDPEDLVQETWARCLRRFSTFDPTRSPFRAWILKIARFVLIEASRALPSGPPTTSASGGTSFFSGLPARGSGELTKVSRNEALERFLESVGSLSDPDRELVVLRGIEGRGFAEVAERLGCNPDALMKRWQRLRARFLEVGPPGLLL